MHQLSSDRHDPLKGKQRIAAGLLIALLLFCALLCGCGAPAPVLYPDATPYDPIAYARECVENGNFEEARAAIADIEGREADAVREECALAEQEALYLLAEKTGEAGSFAEAAELYASLEGYRDSGALAEEMKAREEEALLEEAQLLCEESVAALLTVSGEDTASVFGSVKADIADAAPLCPEARWFDTCLTLLFDGDGCGLYDAVRLAEAEKLSVTDHAGWAAIIEKALSFGAFTPDGALSLLWAANGLDPRALPEDGESEKMTDPDAEFGSGLRADDEELISRAGTTGSEKVLIYTTRRYYTGSDMAFIDLERMRLLPRELTPVSAEDAGWIIHIHYDYKNVKQFTTFYNQGVQEYTTVQILEVPGGTEVGTKYTVKGIVARSKDTAKKTSEFISGGPPDEGRINENMRKCLDWIQKKNEKNREKAAGN